MALRKAKLSGFPSPLPQASPDDQVNWDLAKAWEDELENIGASRPRTIDGIDKVADVDTILRSILPWRVSNSDVLRLQSTEVILKCRNDNENQLDRMLDRINF